MMSDPPPAMADDGWQLMVQWAELEFTIPIAGPRMIRLGGDQVAAHDQFVALDGGVAAHRPLVILENFGVVLDTNN